MHGWTQTHKAYETYPKLKSKANKLKSFYKQCAKWALSEVSVGLL